MSEALIFASINPQHEDRLFIVHENCKLRIPAEQILENWYSISTYLHIIKPIWYGMKCCVGYGMKCCVACYLWKKYLRTFVNTFVLCIEKGRQNCEFEDSEQMVVK